MRKFLMAAGLLALVACGDKKPAADAGTMAPPAAAATDTGMKKDTGMAMSKDTGMKKDTGMAAPKKP